MKRPVLACALSGVLALGGVTPAFAEAASVADRPTAAATVAVAAGNTGAAVAAADTGAAVAADNTRAVCDSSARTVNSGLDEFAATMHSVSDNARKGDLTTAEQSVHQAGGELVTLAGQLRHDARPASSTQIRSTLGQLADEFEKQGRQLTTLASLERFDIQRIQQLSDQMSTLCAPR